MPRRRYTDAERTAALELYRTDGPTAVQTQMGIHKGTVTRWAKDAGIATVANERNAASLEAQRIAWEERRTTLAHRMGEVAQHALELAETKLNDDKPSSAKDAVTTMAILVDKAQLLTGAATSRSEHVAADDDTVNALRDELADRRARRAA